MNTKPLTTSKIVLWALVGMLVPLTVVRFTRGLGAVTNLSDAQPWGIWIAFDVMGGVALAAGGFLLAATVYIFGREKYRPFVRPAVLTAFLGYAAVVVGLLYDLGLPWNIWHPMIWPQLHSVLFEVAMCVMLYLTVLALEFAPTALEHPLFDRPLFRAIHKTLKKSVIVLVILGIVLSTLHQSSLGSLFLITPYRLHPLWYSPIIWALFLVSAMGLGLMVVVAESLFSAWLFGHKLRLDLLAGLAKAAATVLLLYAALRLGDLARRGQLHLAFDGSWQASVFLFEICLSALIPAMLLLLRPVRTSAAGLGLCSAMTILGMVGYRFDVCIVAFARRLPYFPSWIEIAVSLGVLAAAMLVFIFFVENLKVYAEDHHAIPGPAPAANGQDVYNPAATRSLLFPRFALLRRYSLAIIFGVALALAMLPRSALYGQQEQRTPVSAPRTLSGWMLPLASHAGHRMGIAWPNTPLPANAKATKLMVIAGNRSADQHSADQRSADQRNGWSVLFPHDFHVEKLGSDSCGMCHHQNMPFDTNSSCFECHRDMYGVTDIFNHALHVDKLNGNDGCVRCHQDAGQPKNRDTALACTNCHQAMAVAGSFVQPPKSGTRGFAPSYMDAMHGLCVSCHEKKLALGQVDQGPGFAQCANCHRDTDATDFYKRAPYAAE